MFGLRRTRRKRRSDGLAITVTTVGLALAVGLLAALGRWCRDYPAHHFGVVEPSVLYRSGQPGEKGWRLLRDRFGVRTVISLCGGDPTEDGFILEKKFCQANGIRLVNILIGTKGPTESQLRRFLEIVQDPRCRPVLVHCDLGSSRTGVMVAAYRILVQGWSYDQALEDSYRYKEPMEPDYRDFLAELCKVKHGKDVPGALSY